MRTIENSEPSFHAEPAEALRVRADLTFIQHSPSHGRSTAQHMTRMISPRGRITRQLSGVTRSTPWTGSSRGVI
jgi:hypothetical protein